MGYETGTFQTMPELMNKLNTFLVADGWTALKGETDMDCKSPKAARYWRINVRDTISTGDFYREVQSVELRTTSGGSNVATNTANWSCSNDAVAGVAGVVAGTGCKSGNIGGARWWLAYDFGSATIIREAVIESTSAVNRAPLKFEIQWSNDGFTWTNMWMTEASGFTTGLETRTFTWDSGSGYRSPIHPSDTTPRRSGNALTLADVSNDKVLGYGGSDIWAWQGPGYDADRRVYVMGWVDYDGDNDTESVKFNAGTDIDTGLSDWEGTQAGASDQWSYLLAQASTTKTYFFFATSLRIIIVIKNGLDDYTSAYIGFFKPFALPDDYAFPLYVGACAGSLKAMSSAAANDRVFFDPGDLGAAQWRDWNGNWTDVDNHNGIVAVNDPHDNPQTAMWPWHPGAAGRNEFPYSCTGDYIDYQSHFLDRIDPTEQNELPLFAALLIDITYGNLGALDGVYAIPRGGVISAEDEITIGTSIYKVFPNRDRSNGDHYAAIYKGETP